jgi:hypothetical protein
LNRQHFETDPFFKLSGMGSLDIERYEQPQGLDISTRECSIQSLGGKEPSDPVQKHPQPEGHIETGTSNEFQHEI